MILMLQHSSDGGGAQYSLPDPGDPHNDTLDTQVGTLIGHNTLDRASDWLTQADSPSFQGVYPHPAAASEHEETCL